MLPIALSQVRRRNRRPRRDRMEQEGRAFFQRVEAGYQAAAAAQPGRIRRIDATRPAAEVGAEIWDAVAPCLARATKSRRLKSSR
jgi:dTMP kinase